MNFIHFESFIALGFVDVLRIVIISNYLSSGTY